LKTPQGAPKTAPFRRRRLFGPGRELKVQRKEFKAKRKEIKTQRKEMKVRSKEMKI
jgi:hypothetical protein